MEDHDNGTFANHFLDLSSENEYSNTSLNDSVYLGSDKVIYDFSYVQDDLPTKNALGYLAIDKFVLGIILDAKTAAKTAQRGVIHDVKYNDGTIKVISADIDEAEYADGLPYEDKDMWAGRSTKDKNFSLSHKNEVVETVPCVNNCGFKSSNSDRLANHMKICLLDDDEKPYGCPICGHRSYTDKLHCDHLVIHMTHAPFKCFHCDQMCTTRSYFRDHFVSKHKKSKWYECTMCSFRSTRRNCLQSHMASHASKKAEKCNLCGHKCKDRVGLKIHMLKHTKNPWKGGRSFSCSLCGQKYKQKAALERHLYAHKQGESINPLKCSLCIFSCKQGAKLQRHMVNCHPDSLTAGPQGDDSIEQRPYACTICDFRFIRAADLLQHTRTHLTVDTAVHQT